MAERLVLIEMESNYLKSVKNINEKHMANQSKVICGVSKGHGDKSYFGVSGSHDRDGRYAHIYGKTPSKIFFSITKRPMTLKLGM